MFPCSMYQTAQVYTVVILVFGLVDMDLVDQFLSGNLSL